jgi:hypothetical protein
MRIIMINNRETERYEAEAIIMVVKRGNTHALVIEEDGNLTEEWWRCLPDKMKETVESSMANRAQ